MKSFNDIIIIIEDAGKSCVNLGPEATTIIAAIAIGYALRAAKAPKIIVPWITLFITGPICYWVFSNSGDQPYTVNNPLIAQLIKGFILGFVGWGIHRAFLKNTLDNKLFKLDDNGDTKVEESK